MQLRFEVFQGKSGLSQLATAWRQLSGRLEKKQHFHCIEWYMALAETFEAHELGTLFFVGVFSANELLAVLPFRPIKLEFAGTQLRAMQLLSDAWEAQTARDFIMEPSLARSKAFQIFVESFDRQDQFWDVISLRGILDDSFASLALKSSPDVPVLKTPGGIWGRVEYISCGESDRPFDRLSKGFKQNLRTSHNKLKSADFNFVAAQKPEDLLALYPEFLKVESSGWKGAQGTSVAKQPVVSTFLSRLISSFGPAGACEIHLMKIKGRAIAALFCIVVDRISYILKIGYDEDFEKASPGHLIVEHLVKVRGATGAINSITPYNAPPWFSAWKPDTIVGISDAYVFRPSRRGADLQRKLLSSLDQTGVPISKY